MEDFRRKGGECCFRAPEILKEKGEMVCEALGRLVKEGKVGFQKKGEKAFVSLSHEERETFRKSLRTSRHRLPVKGPRKEEGGEVICASSLFRQRTKLLLISGEALRKLMKQNRKVGVEITERVAETYYNRLNNTRAMITNLFKMFKFKNLKSKLIEIYCERYKLGTKGVRPWKTLRKLTIRVYSSWQQH